ncbi:MAG: hypothetical protein PHQ59_05460 [Candidatus Daviesbacteria bacterium]|nr:hypothetical protein [Candidatus Daviesbacteria bacterium]
MGYCYHELVPPAILLDNPGLTKEEFIEQLDQTHVSQFQEFKIKDPWDSHDEEETIYHQGLSGLVDILGLEEGGRFLQTQTPTIDANGLKIRPPFLSHDLVRDPETRKLALVKEVVIHLGNKVGKPTKLQISSAKELHEGNILTAGNELFLPKYADQAKILSITREKWVTETYEDGWGDPEEFKVCNYVLKVLPIHIEEETKRYRTDEEMYQDYPQFHPAFRYDFDQPKGKFSISLSKGRFRWYQQEGRFYLDPETFDRLLANTTSVLDRFGYVDLILTAEAIKNQAWKMLSRRGLIHMRKFLKDFPEANQRYEKAIFNSFLSLAAKRRQQTNIDLLRMRLQPGIKPLDSSI